MHDLKKLDFQAPRLREARGTRTLEEVAHVLGITKQRLWNWEAGLHDPSAAMLIRLCALYEKPIEFFSNATGAKKNFAKV